VNILPDISYHVLKNIETKYKKKFEKLVTFQ